MEINGQNACTIDVWGNVYSGCDNIDMELMEYNTSQGYGYGYNTFQNNGNGSYSGYGYGYGYGKSPGSLSYNVSIQTPHPFLFLSGGNKVKIKVNTGSQVLESNDGTILLIPQIQGDGNFLMATEDLALVLHGKYNSTDLTLSGLLYLVGNTTARWAAAGTYKPFSTDSGLMEFRLYDITRVNDAGVVWSGNYSSGRWYLSPEGQSEYLSGHMYAAPQ